jgi:hypothetical protein
VTAFTPPEVPPCPACGSDGTRSSQPNLGRFECSACFTFYAGTTTEYERGAYHRENRVRRGNE